MTESATPRSSWMDRFFFTWFPGEALGVVRMYFGYGLILYLLSQYTQLLALDLGGAQFHYTVQIWYFGVLGIDHIVPWTNWVAMIAMLGACVCFARGRWTKPAIVVIIACIFYLKGVRDSISGDVHHREVPIIACLILFLASRCDQVFGVDARRRKLPMIADWEASWPLRAMQVYIVMFYFWALIAKLRVSGLYWFENGGRIQDMLLSRALRDGLSPDGTPLALSQSLALAQHPKLVFLFGAGVFIFELLAPLVLFTRSLKWRVSFVVEATIFHLCNLYLLNVQFYLYPFVFVTFFNMAVVHRWLKAQLGRTAPLQVPP